MGEPNLSEKQNDGCINCGSDKRNFIDKTFKNGTKHIEIRCAFCDYFFGYKAHVQTNEFTVPFGKHKGETLRHVKETSLDYLKWLSTIAKPGLKARIDEVLKGD